MVTSPKIVICPSMWISTSDKESQSYAKQQLVTKQGKSNLLGVLWEKDKIYVSFLTSTTELTNRGILTKVTQIYDPLGLASSCDPLWKKSFTEMPVTHVLHRITPYHVTYQPNGGNGNNDFQS